MNAGERISTILAGGIPDDRIGMNDTMWSSTVDRWHKEGLAREESPRDHFGVNDFCLIGADYSLMLAETTLEESEEHRIYVDHNGVTCKCYRMPQGWVNYPLDFAIKSEEDWRRHEAHMPFARIGCPPTRCRPTRAAGQKGNSSPSTATLPSTLCGSSSARKTSWSGCANNPNWSGKLPSASGTR
jgi:hypothetical protein